MKRRDLILFIGIIVASIIGTKSFAIPIEKSNSKKINPEEVDRIIKTIKDNPEFSIFYQAIEQAELSEAIAKLDKMTLMIPTNRAIKMLPSDVWENFMDEENKEGLVQLLSYHVIPERLNLDELKRKEKLNTINKQSVSLTNKKELKIENAVVQEKKEETKDIIIYKLDRLIMPLK
ncbi:fasciclin domain-containing protein [Marivirga sp.]|uniref:fasciclin domain-containing protein n=1 Tax=Marivirga sp. TaxID=2018662 RepID=UPI003DA79783